MANYARLFCGELDAEYTRDTEERYLLMKSEFSSKMEGVISRGFIPTGTPSLTFNEVARKLEIGQLAQRNDNKVYESFQRTDQFDIVDDAQYIGYRMALGDNSTAFCEHIEATINQGWKILGGPVAVRAHGKTIHGLAFIKLCHP